MKRMSSKQGKQAGIGLVIDADAVRAVAIDRRGGITVTRAGEVPLAPGAVSGGEITDVAHVTEALRELWRVGEFDAKDINLAIGSPRVAIRPVDVPNMADDELRSSLKFQIGDHLPINPDDAIVDFQDLGGVDTERDTRPVLLVAAHRDIVNSAVDAAREAGLRVRRIDVIPLLLARVAVPMLPSVAAAASGGETQGPALEALVDVGDDVTNVVLLYAGMAVFARTLGAGLGRDVLAAGADASALADRLFPLMEEVRNTLSFAATQLRAGKVSAVLASVPAAHETLLTDCLRATLGVPIVPLRATDLLAAYGGSSPYNLDRCFLAAAALGLPAAVRTGSHTPSLLPDAFHAADSRRRQQLALAGAVGLVAAGLAVVSLAKAHTVSDLEAKAAASVSAEADLQRKLGTLQPVAIDAAALRARTDQLKLAVSGSIDYPRLLNEIADKLPAEAAATGISVSRTAVNFGVVAESTSAPTQILDATATDGRLTSTWIAQITIRNPKDAKDTRPPQTQFTVEAKPSAAALADRLTQFGVK